MTIDHRWPLAARHFPLGEIRRVLSGTPRRANWFVAGVIIRSHPLARLRLPAARRASVQLLRNGAHHVCRPEENRRCLSREKVRDRQAAGKISATHIIANPTLAREWIVFFKKDGGRSYFLVDESDEVMSFRRLDDAVKELRGLGIKFAEIHL